MSRDPSFQPGSFQISNVAEFQENGKNLLQNIFICLRMSSLYDPSNEAYKKPVMQLHSRIDTFFSMYGEIKMIFSEGQVYLNDTRLKLDSSSFEWVNETTEYFAQRDVGGLRITSPPAPKSLFDFFSALRSTPKKNPKETDEIQSPREILLRNLSNAGVKEIIPMSLLALTDEEEAEEKAGTLQAVNMYISGMISFKNLALSGYRASKTMNLVDLTRVVQGLSDAEDSFGSGILSLITIKNCEHFLLSHSMNVCLLSIVLGKKLGLTKAHLCNLALAALLHDIGQFDTEESESNYDEHPFKSYKLVMQTGEINQELLIRAASVLDHHISYDGKMGFPEFRLGLKPHLFSRIIAIADAYDSMTTPAKDTKPVLPDVAIRSIVKKSGTAFDPVVTQAFVETLGKYPVGTLVELDNGDLGIVVRSGKGDGRIVRPIVLLVRDRFGNKIENYQIVDLTEKHPRRKAFLREIVCSHDPAKIGINVSGFLIDFYSAVESAKRSEQKEN